MRSGWDWARRVGQLEAVLALLVREVDAASPATDGVATALDAGRHALTDPAWKLPGRE